MIPKLKLSEQIPYQASKWLQIYVLLDAQELKNLLDKLGECFLVRISGVSKRGEEIVSQEDFLASYAAYISRLKEGTMPKRDDFDQLFRLAITKSIEDLYAVFVGEDKQLIRIRRPVVQVQQHTFDYSTYDHKFRSQVLGSEAVTWGLQFSFPQLFEDPITNEICHVLTSGDFLNGPLFRSIQKWMRLHTIPTPFEAEGNTVNSSIRLGKNCLDWINRHPGLKTKGLKIVC